MHNSQMISKNETGQSSFENLNSRMLKKSLNEAPRRPSKQEKMYDSDVLRKNLKTQAAGKRQTGTNGSSSIKIMDHAMTASDSHQDMTKKNSDRVTKKSPFKAQQITNINVSHALHTHQPSSPRVQPAHERQFKVSYSDATKTQFHKQPMDPSLFKISVPRAYMEHLQSDDLDEISRLEVVYKILKDQLREHQATLIKLK